MSQQDTLCSPYLALPPAAHPRISELSPNEGEPKVATPQTAGPASFAFDADALWDEMLSAMERRSVHPWPNVNSQGVQYLQKLHECFLCAVQSVQNPHAVSHTSPVATPVSRKRRRGDTSPTVTGSPSRPRRLEFSWPRSGTALADAVLVPTNGQIRFKLVGYPDHISHRNLSIRITNTSPAPDEPLNGADVTHLFQRSWSEHQEPKGKHTLCTLQPTSATSRVGYFLSGSQRLLKKTSHIVRFFLSTDETQGVTWNRRMKIMAKDNKRIEKHDQEFLVEWPQLQDGQLGPTDNEIPKLEVDDHGELIGESFSLDSSLDFSSTTTTGGDEPNSYIYNSWNPTYYNACKKLTESRLKSSCTISRLSKRIKRESKTPPGTRRSLTEMGRDESDAENLTPVRLRKYKKKDPQPALLCESSQEGDSGGEQETEEEDEKTEKRLLFLIDESIPPVESPVEEDQPLLTELYLLLLDTEPKRKPAANTPFNKKREPCVAWLCEVCKSLELQNIRAIMHLAVSLLDLLSDYTEKSGLAALACLSIAAKQEGCEQDVPPLTVMSNIVGTIDAKHIRLMELAVLDHLEWRVMRSTAYTFFTNLIHRGALKMNPEYDSIDGKPITPAEALSLEHQLLVHGYSYCDSSLQVARLGEEHPALVASAAIACSRRANKVMPLWPTHLTAMSAFDLEQVHHCCEILWQAKTHNSVA